MRPAQNVNYLLSELSVNSTTPRARFAQDGPGERHPTS